MNLIHHFAEKSDLVFWVLRCVDQFSFIALYVWGWSEWDNVVFLLYSSHLW